MRHTPLKKWSSIDMDHTVPPIQRITPHTGRVIAEGDTVHNIIEPSANAEGSEEAEATWKEEKPA